MSEFVLCPECHEQLEDNGACLHCPSASMTWEQRGLPEPRSPRKRLSEMTGAEFGEAIADMVKAIERQRNV